MLLLLTFLYQYFCSSDGNHNFFIKGIMKQNARRTFNKLSWSSAEVIHELTISIKQLNLDSLHDTLMERSTPGNSLYQQWLSREEIGAFVSNPAASAAVTQWLVSHNVNIISTTLYGEYITASAPITVWQTILNTTFYRWRGEQEKEFNRAESYSIPHYLDPHISAIFQTTQFPPTLFRTPYQSRRTHDSQTSDTSKSHSNFSVVKDSSNFQGTTVSFLSSLYKIPSNIGNSTLSQAVFETNSEEFQQSDITKFQTKYGLGKQPAEVFGTSPKGSGCNTNSCGEGSLDIQYIMGVAQNSKSVFWYEALGDGDAFFNFLVHVANSTNPPTSLSISWTAYEYQVDPSFQDQFNAEAMKLSLMGVTIFVSSGDDGVSGFDCLCTQDSSAPSTWTDLYNTSWSGQGYFAQYPATSPYVVAVGATMGPESNGPEVACQVY